MFATYVSNWLVFSRSHSSFVHMVLSGKDVGNYATSQGVKTWRILAQEITVIVTASPSVLNMFTA